MKRGGQRSGRLFGVEFRLARDGAARYCEIVADAPDGIRETLQGIYGDLDEVTEIDDNGECDENGELIENENENEGENEG